MTVRNQSGYRSVAKERERERDGVQQKEIMGEEREGEVRNNKLLDKLLLETVTAAHLNSNVSVHQKGIACLRNGIHVI